MDDKSVLFNSIRLTEVELVLSLEEPLTSSPKTRAPSSQLFVGLSQGRPIKSVEPVASTIVSSELVLLEEDSLEPSSLLSELEELNSDRFVQCSLAIGSYCKLTFITTRNVEMYIFSLIQLNPNFSTTNK